MFWNGPLKRKHTNLCKFEDLTVFVCLKTKSFGPVWTNTPGFSDSWIILNMFDCGPFQKRRDASNSYVLRVLFVAVERGTETPKCVSICPNTSKSRMRTRICRSIRVSKIQCDSSLVLPIGAGFLKVRIPGSWLLMFNTSPCQLCWRPIFSNSVQFKVSSLKSPSFLIAVSLESWTRYWTCSTRELSTPSSWLRWSTCPAHCAPRWATAQPRSTGSTWCSPRPAPHPAPPLPGGARSPLTTTARSHYQGRRQTSDPCCQQWYP